VTGTDGFDDFYQATFGRLVAQVYLVTGDLHEAEDVVQEAMARASVRWQRLRDYDLPEAWVRRVAMNLAADQRRRVRRRLALLARIGPSPPAPALSVDRVAVVRRLPRCRGRTGRRSSCTTCSACPSGRWPSS
jgi:RNA polymerase sigma-70 factor, ECF subfamily